MKTFLISWSWRSIVYKRLRIFFPLVKLTLECIDLPAIISKHTWEHLKWNIRMVNSKEFIINIMSIWMEWKNFFRNCKFWKKQMMKSIIWLDSIENRSNKYILTLTCNKMQPKLDISKNVSQLSSIAWDENSKDWNIILQFFSI